MSSICSQGMVLATAMAVSGTVILLALRLQKTPLRSCISSEEKKLKEKKKKKKRVQFAENVEEPRGNGEEFRRKHSEAINGGVSRLKKSEGRRRNRRMPENRVALYNGILRDRVVQRMACSY